MFIRSRSFTSLISPKRSNFSLSKFALFSTFASSAEKLMTHLQKNESNVEKSLDRVKIKLNTACINEVLQRCSVDKPQMGLRFFIWAGLQPKYRHSAYMYGQACKLLEIKQNPQFISDVIEAYRMENCAVSVKMFKVLLYLCREAKDANLGLWVLRKMKEFNCRPDTTAYNVVIAMFCEKREVDEAMKLMEEMGLIELYPDMITYVAVLKGLSDIGRLEDAFRLVKAMKGHGCVPNAVVYSILLDGICRFGSLERAMEMLREMEKESGDSKPNLVTYTAVVQRFCEMGQSMDALTILDQMREFGCKPNKTTMSVLIKGLCAEGRIEEAYKVIDKVAGESVSYDECYSSLVLSLWQVGKLEEAEKVFRMILVQGLRPDGAASSTVLRQLCLVGRWLDAFRLCEGIEDSGNVSIDADIYSILLAGLCQEKKLVEAAKLGKLMVERGVQLQAPYVDDVVKHLKNSDEEELVSKISRISS
ncbi:pentatricopeptide repeat-containing protein At5g47360-like [Coffea eugenioides]|uniref:pentatricopeptide repeat-containing protein At5g47360-like n=1 Tax=Coffea eugenioides TaxID=49369 RepID=UPI000F604670|nr:pentatricopeptide repeat-containing protein At5g47360-like [Coffea eugenioides]XP_027182669.1 pentatricopeptide repeat-containing protein At5g47360-like [Coffea eugenioides]